MDAKKKVGIIGYGWLGEQLAEVLMAADYEVVATSRSNSNGETIQYDIKSDELPDQLKDLDYAIICIPPFRSDDDKAYGTALASVAKAFSDNTRVIFTSSTGTYPSRPGEYKEDYQFDASDMNELSYGEEALQNVLVGRLTILRLGGLIGVDRHPINFLSGRKIAQGGNDQIALIDGRDICAIIANILGSNLFGETYNLTFPLELSKREYYAKVAAIRNVDPPQYETEKSAPRRVNNEKAVARFGHLFRHDLFG